MSKRDRGALIEEYRQKNFLPAAVRNYLCLLGWNPKNDREIMDISEIVELFDFPGIVKSNARFDERKMAHFNTEHIRALAPEKFAELARAAIESESGINLGGDGEYVAKVFALCQPKVANMESFPSMVRFFFSDEFPYDAAAREKVFKKGDPLARLEELNGILPAMGYFSRDAIYAAIADAAAGKGLKTTEYFPVLRYAVSGMAGGPDLMPALEVLGRERVLKRISSLSQGAA